MMLDGLFAGLALVLGIGLDADERQTHPIAHQFWNQLVCLSIIFVTDLIPHLSLFDPLQNIQLFALFLLILLLFMLLHLPQSLKYALMDVDPLLVLLIDLLLPPFVHSTDELGSLGIHDLLICLSLASLGFDLWSLIVAFAYLRIDELELMDQGLLLLQQFLLFSCLEIWFFWRSRCRQQLVRCLLLEAFFQLL